MRVEQERHAHERRLLEEEGVTSDMRMQHDAAHLEQLITQVRGARGSGAGWLCFVGRAHARQCRPR